MIKNKRIKQLVYFAVVILLLGKYGISPDKSLAELSPKYASIEQGSKFVKIEGSKIHYRDQGKGYPIVLIHGTGASLHTWDEWTRTLTKYFRVIRIDLPAYGLTGEDPKKRYSSKDYVDLLHAFLKEHQVNRFYLAGNSLGGLVSWLYASYYPEEVEKLLLLDPSGFPFKGTPMVIQMAKTPIINLFLRYLTPKSFIKQNLEEVFYQDDLVTPALIDRYYDLTLYDGNRQAFIDRAYIEREDYTERLTLIEAPTLILWGENDEWIPVADAQKFDKEIKNSEVVIMPETGHVPMEERPVESVAIALEFLTN